MVKYYVLLLTASVLFSMQFVFTKCYQKAKGSGFFYSLIFGIIVSFVSVPLFFVVNKCKFEFSLVSLGLACVYAFINIALSAFSTKALSCADLSLFSLSMLLGGMVVPFIYGICMGETVTVWKIIAVIAVTASLFVSMKKNGEKNTSVLAVVCIAAVFILNGLSGVIVSFHQQKVENAVSSGAFMMLINAARFAISVAVIAIIAIRNKIVVGSVDGEIKCFDRYYELSSQDGVIAANDQSSKKQEAKKWLVAIAVSVGFAVVNGVGNFFTTVSAANVPAVVMYPIITGCGVLFSSLFGLFFGEKITARTIISVVLVLFGTVLMMF